MKPFLKNIILIGNDKEKRVLEFNQGLNIITGDSKTGKSAIIEIVDFCLFSKRSTIPVGVVKNFTEIFCSVFEFEKKLLIIARLKSNPNKCYFCVEYDDSFDICSSLNNDYFLNKKLKSRGEAQQEFEEHLGLSIENTSLPEDEFNGRNKGKVSIRNATSLFFQHQNLVANKHGLFYRFDDFLKGSAVIDQFPIFMGWVNNKYYRLKKRADKLDKDIKTIEKEEKRLKLSAYQQRDKLLVPIKQYYKVLNLQFTENDASLSRVKEIAENLPVVPVNAEQNVDFKRQIKALENKKKAKLSDLYECNKIIDLIKENEGESYDFSHTMSHLVELSTIESKLASDISCPVCNSTVKSVGDKVDSVQKSRELLLNELSRVGTYKNDSSKALNMQLLKRDKIKLNISAIDQEIRQIKKIFNVKDDFAIRDILNQIKGRIEANLELIFDSHFQEKKNSNLSELKEEFDECQKELRGYGLEHKFTEANVLINKTMNELKDKLDFEDDLRNGEMKFRTQDFSFYYYCEGQEIRLSEMGSGANWLACHLAVFLSILKLIAKSNSVIPAMLFLDQPSQVYFPKVTHRFSSIKNKEILDGEDFDENIKQVVNIFTVINEFIDDIAKDKSILFRPQVIVLEHADEPEFEDFVRYRWSTNGKKLI